MNSYSNKLQNYSSQVALHKRYQSPNTGTNNYFIANAKNSTVQGGQPIQGEYVQQIFQQQQQQQQRPPQANSVYSSQNGYNLVNPGKTMSQKNSQSSGNVALFMQPSTFIQPLVNQSQLSQSQLRLKQTKPKSQNACIPSYLGQPSQAQQSLGQPQQAYQSQGQPLQTQQSQGQTSQAQQSQGQENITQITMTGRIPERLKQSLTESNLNGVHSHISHQSLQMKPTVSSSIDKRHQQSLQGSIQNSSARVKTDFSVERKSSHDQQQNSHIWKQPNGSATQSYSDQHTKVQIKKNKLHQMNDLLRTEPTEDEFQKNLIILIYFKGIKIGPISLNVIGRNVEWLTKQLINEIKMFQQIQEDQTDCDADRIVYFSSYQHKNISLSYYLTLPERTLDPLLNKSLILEPFYSEALSKVPTQNDNEVAMKDFHFIKCVGMGGFSRVYLVQKRDTGKMYALKLIEKKFILTNKKEVIVQNERNIMTIMQGHPFLLQLDYAFESKNYIVFAMEYCAGGEMFYHLRKIKKMTEDQARFYFIEICLGIDFLHDRHIIYRDIKPENIFLDIDGHIRIGDFGLSKPDMDENEFAYSFCGSPEYMAPEMLLKVGHGYPVDHYTLGALLYELVTGLPPFYSQVTEEIYQSILSEELTFPEHAQLSNELKNLLRGLLTKHPLQRLGQNTGVKEILGHSWCKKINLGDIINKKITPPIKIDVIGFNFDEEEFSKGEVEFKAKLMTSYYSTKKDFTPIFQKFYYESPSVIHQAQQLAKSKQLQIKKAHHHISEQYDPTSYPPHQTSSSSSSHNQSTLKEQQNHASQQEWQQQSPEVIYKSSMNQHKHMIADNSSSSSMRVSTSNIPSTDGQTYSESSTHSFRKFNPVTQSLQFPSTSQNLLGNFMSPQKQQTKICSQEEQKSQFPRHSTAERISTPQIGTDQKENKNISSQVSHRGAPSSKNSSKIFNYVNISQNDGLSPSNKKAVNGSHSLQLDSMRQQETFKTQNNNYFLSSIHANHSNYKEQNSHQKELSMSCNKPLNVEFGKYATNSVSSEGQTKQKTATTLNKHLPSSLVSLSMRTRTEENKTCEDYENIQIYTQPSHTNAPLHLKQLPSQSSQVNPNTRVPFNIQSTAKKQLIPSKYENINPSQSQGIKIPYQTQKIVPQTNNPVNSTTNSNANVKNLSNGSSIILKNTPHITNSSINLKANSYSLVSNTTNNQLNSKQDIPSQSYFTSGNNSHANIANQNQLPQTGTGNGISINQILSSYGGFLSNRSSINTAYPKLTQPSIKPQQQPFSQRNMTSSRTQMVSTPSLANKPTQSLSSNATISNSKVYSPLGFI